MKPTSSIVSLADAPRDRLRMSQQNPTQLCCGDHHQFPTDALLSCTQMHDVLVHTRLSNAHDIGNMVLDVVVYQATRVSHPTPLCMWQQNTYTSIYHSVSCWLLCYVSCCVVRLAVAGSWIPVHWINTEYRP